jgi:hypothetical protein
VSPGFLAGDVNVGCFFVLQLSEEIARRDAEREEMERIRMELVLEEQEEKERQKEMVSSTAQPFCSNFLHNFVICFIL